MRTHSLFTSALLLSLILSPRAQAGPPFQTDDPEPVPWHHYEAYVFSTVNRGGGATSWMLPAVEFNVGAAPNLQLHVTVPDSYVNPGSNYGLGDIELGAKYRFIDESGHLPQAGVFPLIELPSGDDRLGLGNGHVWARLPLWLQKSHGPWTTYGGAGYEINHAPGMKDSTFAGWLLQRQITKRLTLGAEEYYQGAETLGAQGSMFTDAGGYYNFLRNLSLLFMLGHTVAGERQTVAYVGLYYTWGRGA
jgi:Putative MetA-pathway of phenol degradation